jgi:acetyl esterase/lipase
VVPYALELRALHRLTTGAFGILLSLHPAVGAAVRAPRGEEHSDSGHLNPQRPGMESGTRDPWAARVFKNYPDYPAWQDPQLENEDCLYLNIWTPSQSGNDQLPVMVWIHGGAYFSGSAGLVSRVRQG